MADEETEQVISNLRACLLSMKGGIPINSLDRDYKILIGHSIPFRKLGFDSLETFLRSIPNVSISRRNGEIVLDAIPSKNTEHLAALIARQKSAPRKIRPTRMGQRRTAASQWKPPPAIRPPRLARRPNTFMSGPRHISVTVSSPRARAPKPVRQVSFNDMPVTTYPAPASLRASPSGPAPAAVSVPTSPDSASPPAPASALASFPVSIPAPFPEFSSPSAPALASLALSATTSSTMPAPTSVGFSSMNSAAPLAGRLPQTYETPPRFRLNTTADASVTRVSSRLSMAAGSGTSMPQSLFNMQVTKTTLIQNGAIAAAGDMSAQMARLSMAQCQPATTMQMRYRNGRVSQVPIVLMTLDNPCLQEILKGLSQDAPIRLQQLARNYNWDDPMYKLMPRFPKGEPIMYSCTVKVSEQTYTSYPDEHPIPGNAVLMAAHTALLELSKKDAGQQLPITTDKEELLTRVVKIVVGYPSGIWDSQIPIDYANNYSEKLPAEWLTLIQSCPSINMEHVAPNRAILTASPAETGIVVPMPTAIWPTLHLLPEPLNMPQDDVWDVFVTYAQSTTEVWIRLIGDDYSAKYEAMATEMEMHYMEKRAVAMKTEVGYYYAVQLDGCWHRVQLTEKNESNQTGLVFFVDHGDEDTFSLDVLHVLEPKFTQLPLQAVQITLSGLEDFSSDMNATKHLVDTVIGKTLVAEVVSRSGPEEDGVVSVVLYDTSTEEDVNVNRVLAEQISQDALAPRLPEDGEIREVYVSYISDEGDAYLHIRSDSFVYLKTLMEKLMEVSIQNDHMSRASARERDPTKLYLARYSLDFQWYRATIQGEPDENGQVMVHFVDYGNCELVPVGTLLLLGQLSEPLERFPHQAIKVNLHNLLPDVFTSKMAERLRELVPEDDPILVKVVKPGSANEPPHVEMFKRTQDKQLVSINNTLAMDSDLMKPKTGGAEPKRRRAHPLRPHVKECFPPVPAYRPHDFNFTQRDPLRALPLPPIPDIGHFFDVHVTMAANPSNFTVQPYLERVKLESLMKEMQHYYTRTDQEEVPRESIKEGCLFAAHHLDGYWYRCTVSNIINGDMVSVYFCDFGDVSILNLESLQPLPAKFKDLPGQAIKAKLSRIAPIHSDWTVEDCIRFQEIVVDHGFVSVIIDSGPDIINPNDIVIGLHLFDTTGTSDVDIDQKLVEEKRAVYTSAVQQQLLERAVLLHQNQQQPQQNESGPQVRSSSIYG